MAVITAPRALRRRATEVLHPANVLGMLSTPLLPADFAALIDPLWTTRGIRARVERVERETADAVTLVLRPGRGWREHRAGQFALLGLDLEGVRQWRAYSMTSSPGRSDGRIWLTVKAIPGGRVSNHLVHHTGPGDLVWLDGPQGDFTLPATVVHAPLFLTAGSGITPVMGMLRSGAVPPGAVLVHSAPTPADVIFGAELRDRAGRGELRLIERHTDIDGLLDLAELDGLCPDWRQRQTWACGPAGLLAAAEEHWTVAGVPASLHTERFRAAAAVVGSGGSVTFRASATEAEAPGDTPLLDVGEAAGVAMPYGCRMGVCFGCVAPLTAGAVRDLRTGAVTEAGPGVEVQTCVSAAAGACELAL